MNIRDLVYEEIRAIAAEDGKTLPELSDDMNFLNTGLDSMGMAILVSNLDEKTNSNPLGADDAVMPVTIGDIVHLYDKASEHAGT